MNDATGSTPQTPPDHKLIAHVRALIARDPEGYVRRRWPYALERLLRDVGTDLTGGSGDGSVGPTTRGT